MLVYSFVFLHILFPFEHYKRPSIRRCFLIQCSRPVNSPIFSPGEEDAISIRPRNHIAQFTVHRGPVPCAPANQLFPLCLSSGSPSSAPILACDIIDRFQCGFIIDCTEPAISIILGDNYVVDIIAAAF